MRRAIVFAVLLAVYQVPIPLPGQVPESITITRLPSVSVERDWIDYWTLGFSGLLALIGIGGVIAAIRTLRAIEKQAGLMETQIKDSRKSSEDNSRDVQASIAEATRASKAMEGIAESMASNVKSVKESVDISREIANMQKLATELHSRAYLSAVFSTARFQDSNHVFEVQAVLRNHGNTPAYDVVFKAAAQVVPVPLPDNFAFPLPGDTAGTSVSLIAPGTTKLMNRRVSDRVPNDQVDAIKLGGPSQCLAMWGIVNYQDAFKKTRRTRFAFFVNWIPWIEGHDKDKDGNPLPPQIISFDTAHHNDAD